MNSADACRYPAVDVVDINPISFACLNRGNAFRLNLADYLFFQFLGIEFPWYSKSPFVNFILKRVTV